MTAVDPELRASPPASADPAIDRSLAGICPYLASADGLWRSATVAREHRCGAVIPPAILATEKQRRLCLSPDHTTCPTFEAARAARPFAQDRTPSLPRPLARATPVVLDHGRIAVSMPALRGERSTWQLILIALMGLAFALIVLAKLTGGGTSAGAADASRSPRASVPATLVPRSPGPTTSPTPAPTRAPNGSATTSAAPGSSAPSPTAPTTGTSTKTYKVKAGDTLIGIAAKFGTTVKAIARLNGITNTASLKIGQVLKIP